MKRQGWFGGKKYQAHQNKVWKNPAKGWLGGGEFQAHQAREAARAPSVGPKLPPKLRAGYGSTTKADRVDRRNNIAQFPQRKNTYFGTGQGFYQNNIKGSKLYGLEFRLGKDGAHVYDTDGGRIVVPGKAPETPDLPSAAVSAQARTATAGRPVVPVAGAYGKKRSPQYGKRSRNPKARFLP